MPISVRTSAFSYKGTRLDVKEIGRRLGVEVVLEGSVRRAGDRLRVAAQLVGASIHIVGDVPRAVRSATHHEFIASRERLFELMGRARSVAGPSRIDAAPGILFEASIMGCNVVASRNCGNWELCHPELLAEPYGPDAFAACIGRARARKFTDQLDRFLG